MAIRINLLAEAQAAEEARRKNPVKLGGWIGGFLVALVLIYILKLQIDITFAKKQHDNIEQSMKNNAAKYSSVTNNMAKAADMERKLDALERYSTNRFFWAPVLNALQQTMLDDIVVIGITGEQRFVKEDAASVGSGTTKKLVPGNVTEKIALSVSAKDYNPSAQTYDKFKEKLREFDYFSKSLDPKNTFILDGVLSSPTADPSDLNKQFVTFKLTAHYPDVKRE